MSVPSERRSEQDLASSAPIGHSPSDAALRSEPAIRPEAPLNAGALLELQRTAGNQAVARLVQETRTRPGATRMLLRLPMEGVDPTSDRFWGELAHAAETQLDNWLDNDFEMAINQFEIDLLSSEESGAAEGFMLDTFMTLLAFLPEGGEMAVGVFTIAKGVYDLLPLDSPVELAAFSERARKNKRQLSAQVVNHDRGLKLFRLLHQAKVRESVTGTDMAAREAAKTQITTTIARLPSFTVFRRALTLDWIRSSNDSWDIGSEAGIIWATASFPGDETPPWQKRRLAFGSAQIDDVSRPEGVITSLKSVYGEDTPLELLPIEMVMRIEGRERWAEFVNPPVKSKKPGGPIEPSVKPTDLRAAPRWAFRSGDERFVEVWEQQRVIPTVGDLSAGRYRG